MTFSYDCFFLQRNRARQLLEAGLPKCALKSRQHVSAGIFLQLLFVGGRLRAQPTFLKRPLAHTLRPGSRPGSGAHWSPPLNEAGHAGSSATPPPSPALVRRGAGGAASGLGRPGAARRAPAAGNTAQASSMSPELAFALGFPGRDPENR